MRLAAGCATKQIRCQGRQGILSIVRRQSTWAGVKQGMSIYFQLSNTICMFLFLLYRFLLSVDRSDIPLLVLIPTCRFQARRTAPTGVLNRTDVGNMNPRLTSTGEEDGLRLGLSSAAEGQSSQERLALGHSGGARSHRKTTCSSKRHRGAQNPRDLGRGHNLKVAYPFA